MLVSLDGYIAGAGGELDWFVDGDPDFERYCDEMIDAVGLAIYGRTAYELMLQYWPHAERNPRDAQELAFARKMNALPKLVLSRTLTQADWRNTRIVADDAAEQIAALKRQPGKPIVAWAGASLVDTLLSLRLVDELRLIVHPVLLGSGLRLFGSRDARLRLRLVRTTQLGANLSVLCYEPVYPEAR